MKPTTPPPAPTTNESVRDKTASPGRYLLFVLLILLSPVAAFLCGFCCCLGVMQIEDGVGMYEFPGAFATMSFFVGGLGSLAFIAFLLVRLHKKLFANRSTPTDDEASDGPTSPL